LLVIASSNPPRLFAGKVHSADESLDREISTSLRTRNGETRSIGRRRQGDDSARKKCVEFGGDVIDAAVGPLIIEEVFDHLTCAGQGCSRGDDVSGVDIYAMAAIERNECVIVEQQIELIALVSPPGVQQIESERATGRRPPVERVHGNEVTCGRCALDTIRQRCNL
jgi:hypothetical protein